MFKQLKFLLIIFLSLSTAMNYPKDSQKDKNKKNQNENKKNEYSIEQSVSDKAQLNTIAFDGLAFLSGNLGSYTFLPPGKVADYFGFQYMRDIDIVGGHKMTFLTTIANNVLYILNDEQKAQLIELGKIQAPIYQEFALKRLPLIKAFRRLYDNDIPLKAKGLSLEAVKKYTSELYLIDGNLSYERAKVVGRIIRSLTADQKTKFAKLTFGNSDTWAVIKEEDVIDKTKFSHETHVAVMTYASELFSWYAGNIDADIYFCPERHATYFGSFYMKDMPAVGNINYNISTSLTGDSGESFLALLSDSQREKITNLVIQQKNALNEILKVRRSVVTELRRFMKEDNNNKENIINLSKRYGEFDGEISYLYATAFSSVGNALTDKQKGELKKLRNLDQYECPPDTAFIYADKIKMPEIINTDFLFE